MTKETCLYCARWTPLPTRLSPKEEFGWGACCDPDSSDGDGGIAEVVIIATRRDHACPIWKELDQRQ